MLNFASILKPGIKQWLHTFADLRARLLVTHIHCCAIFTQTSHKIMRRLSGLHSFDFFLLQDALVKVSVRVYASTSSPLNVVDVIVFSTSEALF